MKVEFEVHPIQAEILRVLLFHPTKRFSELNTKKVPTDQFNFHIKSLVDMDLISKDKTGVYSLTAKGKEFSNRFDTEQNKIEKQGKLCVVVCPTKVIDGERYFLIQQRLKQPFFGFHGVITGKIKWGENMEEAAAREFMEEAGLKGKLTFLGLEHKLHVDKNNSLLEDKYFFIFKVENITGKLIENFEGGKNFWLTERDVSRLEKQFEDMPFLLETVKGTEFKVIEMTRTVSEY